MAYVLNHVEMRGAHLAALNICHPNLQNSQHQLNLRLFFMLHYNDLQMKTAFFVTNKNEGTVEEETLTPCKTYFLDQVMDEVILEIS